MGGHRRWSYDKRRNAKLTTIFISYAQNDAAYAEDIRRMLEAKSYNIWREPGYPSATDNSYPRMIENAILGSAAVIVVWSSNAVQSEWVERHILFAQQLKKPLIPFVTDGTDLPNNLIVNTILSSQNLCTDVVAQLLELLPPPDSSDSLINMSEQAAHEFIRVRKEAIDLAANMLKKNEHREAVLATLEYLAHHDLMMGVREKAQEALDADSKKDTLPPVRPADSRHTFGARCRKGHITYFDKRLVCPANSHLMRDLMERAGKKLDALYLKCEQCGEVMVVHADCEGYK